MSKLIKRFLSLERTKELINDCLQIPRGKGVEHPKYVLKHAKDNRIISVIVISNPTRIKGNHTRSKMEQ